MAAAVPFALLALGGPCAAEDPAVAAVQFEWGFLATRASRSIDVSRFEYGNAMLPGIYRVDVYVNDEWKGRIDVPFRDVPAAGKRPAGALPCFGRDLLARLGVDIARLEPQAQARLDPPQACLPIGELVAQAAADYDFGNQRLDLHIANAVLARRARGYIDPAYWDSGGNVAFFNYDANVYRYTAHGMRGDATDAYLGLQGGINLGDWHLRHSGSYSRGTRRPGQYQSVSTYLQRDIPAWSSQVRVGDAWTRGDIFDTTGFRGLRLASDDRMLPDSQRGYAPTIRGIANSNAKVQVRQSGVTLYETTVAPGAFEINDLYPTGFGGDLEVTVTEADGALRSFSVPYAAVPLALRPGVTRYSVAAGTYREPGVDAPPLLQATVQRGLSNLVTAYGGVSASEGYRSVLLGAAFNTPIGALGLDYTQARTDLRALGSITGGSARISYSKNLPELGSNFTLAAYRYSSSGFYSLNEAVRARDHLRGDATARLYPRYRNRMQLTFNQRLGKTWGNLSATASAYNYWGRPGRVFDYTIGYAHHFRSVTYNVLATRRQSNWGPTETQVYAQLSIPLGKSLSTLSSSASHTRHGGTQLQSTLTGVAGEYNNFSYSVTGNHQSGGAHAASAANASLYYQGAYGDVSAYVASGTGFSQQSVGLRGALVAHAGGLTLAQPLSETFGIVHAEHAEGARLVNATGVRLDSRGYAVVPYLTPYQSNTIEIDPKGLSTDVALKETLRQVVPRAGAVPTIRFASEFGRSAVILARHENGAPLPFGAPVLDADGQEIGVVGQGSKIFARGLRDEGRLTVRAARPQACTLHYQLPPRDAGLPRNVYQQITASCRPSTAPAAGRPTRDPS